jgi:hypothetical protein
MFLITELSLSQTELVDVSNNVYSYLKRMQLLRIIPAYNSSAIPITRQETADYLLIVKENLNKLSPVDRKLYKDYESEFEFDMFGTTDERYSLISKQNPSGIISNSKSKSLYYYTDSAFSFFSDVYGLIAQTDVSGDSADHNSLFKGKYGVNARGTMFGQIGYSISISSGEYKITNDSNIENNTLYSPVNLYKGSSDFSDNIYPFTGYLRYQTKTNWLSLTFGRDKLKQGKGFIDKLFLSDNAGPFDFGKLDINYKKINYTFTYGSLKGDSVGRPLDSKNISTHYLNLNFSDAFRMGFWESVIISNQPFSFTYFNPVSFLTSADLSTGREQTTENNALMGLDFELIPFRNFSFQSSLLIDDLTFGTLFEPDSLNENKFGWQFGALWTNKLNMDFSAEFTHLDPFVYSHRTNKSTYTNRSVSLGHALPPNSDEIALKMNYNITNRLNLRLFYSHQRSGTGIFLDSAGKVVANYGGNINFGLGDAYLRTNGFLDGIRINRDIFSAEILWQPIKKFYVKSFYEYIISDNITYNYSLYDSYFYITLMIDI